MNFPKISGLASVLAFSLYLGPMLPAAAATVSLHPVADTTLQEAFPNNNFGDGTSFTAGNRRQGGRTRGLMQFDIAGNLPPGATINSSTLTLTLVGVPDVVGS